ncbi:S8 family serine peptidase [Roseovarius aestuariivivens]|uniref:S8 family serine peptidase n=1 Tax=Roseovarius aestuariivivens TaxID=1888910 RepID=UPI00107FFA26|nr:S8 family serine peptidase [Roseovarius aestuariivivens]
MLKHLLTLCCMLFVAPYAAQASVRIALPDCGLAGLCSTVPGEVRVQQSPGRSSSGGVDPGERGTVARGLPRAARDVVAAPSGAPEYAVLVARVQAAAAQAALQAAGVTLLRGRALPELGQQLLFVALPRTLDVQAAQTLLRQAAPSALIDQHRIYRRSAGPRVYHAAMLGDAPGQSCRLSGAVRVGVIDGAINPGHPALRGVAVTRQSFLGRSEAADAPGHGTAVAALIAGASSAGPLAGLAPGVQLYAAEAFGKARRGPGGRLEAISASLDWLVANRVRLVNMSFAGQSNVVFDRVLALTQARGVVMVAAAGNGGSGAAVFPAAASGTIAVTAVDAAGAIYGRANFGPHIEFAAPGVDLYVASGASGGSYRSGTSFAAPVVTAILARQAARGGLSLQGARGFLRARARDLGPAGRDTRFGYGLVQSGGC